MDGTNSGSTQDNKGDHLGYGVYAQTLWVRIQAALNRDLNRPDKSLGDDPLVVGIFGEWGSGKSFLLRQVMEMAQAEANRRIAEHREQDTEPLTVPVFFQPWKYEHEKHLLVPLLLHIQSDLQSALQRAMPDYSRNRQWLEDNGNALAKHMGRVVEVFGYLMDAAMKAFQIAQPQAMLLMPVAKTLASWLPWNKEKAAAPSMAQFRFDDTGGRSYYEMHAILKAITRPSLGSIKRYLPQTRVDQNFSVNFVVFIDDLDRCLPEKSVEVLELIKTVFNLESFAFVLALDDEVVERGIGHRYKDYALVNKKPEMPITGFEYLEKIVHLPLRLPALTAAQAIAFLPRYEADILQDRASRLPEPQRADWLAKRTWFAPRVVPADGGATADTRQLFHLARLVEASFDACAPRKLVRVVELWHQVLDVLEARELAGLLADVRVGGAIDPRLLMTTVLLQLFQPELFRSLRRSRVGLNVLLDGFKTSSEQTNPLSAAMSDVDLLHWAVYRSGEKPPVDWKAALQCLPDLDPGQRGAAQRQRLPLVERLLEHRSVQRHSFDPLKLLAAVHRSGAGTGSVALPADTFPYFSVLGAARALAVTELGEGPPLLTLETVEAPPTIADPAGSGLVKSPEIEPVPAAPDEPAAANSTPQLPPTQSFRLLTDPVAVFQALISPEDAEQRRVAEVAGLGPDAPLLHPESAQVLRGMVEREFLSARIKGDNEAFVAERRGRVLRGLSYLAPYIPPEERAAWWALVEEAPHQPAPFENLEQLHAQERWMDVRSILGIDCDPVKGRFDPKRFNLPRERYGQHTEAEEPITGFVRVFDKPVEIFQPFKGPEVQLRPFYMARYLTTVDQYADFIADGGYGVMDGQKPDWWDSVGWQWRTGEWDSQIKNKDERYLERNPELRGAPMGWAEQRAHGSRAVMQLSWFEARAYAHWLTLQLKDRLSKLPKGYAVRLPTEAQWERAARAKDAASADERQYPWGGDDQATAHLHANILASDLGRVSPVGLFAPNPLGLCDLSGNVYEWQNNLSPPSGGEQDKGLGFDLKELKTAHLLALRGGAWNEGSAGGARASHRSKNRPHDWYFGIGFRVVLSLGEQAPEI